MNVTSESVVGTLNNNINNTTTTAEDTRQAVAFNNNNNSFSGIGKQPYYAENALLIRELLTCKLAAVSEMMEHSVGVLSSHHHTNNPYASSGHAGAANPPAAAAINNNHAAAASIMNHLLKVRQEMALNMSKDSDSGDDRHTDTASGHEEASDNELGGNCSPEPINLQANGGGRNSSAIGSAGSDGESPLSPNSDGGASSGSAKEQKASRLENIVGGLARTTSSSPAPQPQGCNKRKLYRPVQHGEDKEGEAGEAEEAEEQQTDQEMEDEEPDLKRKKAAAAVGLETQLKSMQDQLVRMQSRFGGDKAAYKDENTDPEKAAGDLQIDLDRQDKKYNNNLPLGHMDEITIEKKLNPKTFAGLGHHNFLNGIDPLVTPPPLPPTAAGGPLNPNYMDLAKRFLQEQQDKITKEMITRDIVHSTLGRNDIADKLAAISPELEGLADILKSEITTSLTIIVDSIVQRFLTAKRQPLAKFEDDNNKQAAAVGLNGGHGKTPSGRAPQVRDRATPRTVSNPLSMGSAFNTAATIVSKASSAGFEKPLLTNIYSGSLPHHSDEDRENEDLLMEQDDALNLVVTPKKKRHKVTDTRITPRTVSRLLGNGLDSAATPLSSIADLHKHFSPSPAGFLGGHPGFPGLPKHLADLPRPPFPGLPPHLLQSLPAHDFPFPPFGFPPAAAAAAALNRPRDLSPPHSDRARSASPPRDTRPPPPLLHPGLLAASPAEDRPLSRTSSGDDLRFDTPGGHTPFSLASMSGNDKLR